MVADGQVEALTREHLGVHAGQGVHGLDLGHHVLAEVDGDATHAGLEWCVIEHALDGQSDDVRAASRAVQTNALLEARDVILRQAEGHELGRCGHGTQLEGIAYGI